MFNLGKSLIARLFTFVKDSDKSNIRGGIMLTIAIFLLYRGKGGTGTATETYISLRKSRVHTIDIDTVSGFWDDFDSTNPSPGELVEMQSVVEVVSPTEQVGVETSLDHGASSEASASMNVSQNEWVVLARKKEIIRSLWDQYKARHHQIDDDVFSLIANRWPEFYNTYYNPLYSAGSFQGSWTATNSSYTNSSYNLLYSEDEDIEMPVPTRPRYKGLATVFIPKLMEFYISSRWDTGNAIEAGTLDSLDSFELKLEEESHNLAHQTLEMEDRKEPLLSDYRHDLCKVGSKLCLKQFDLSIRKSKNRDLREARPVSGVRWDVEVARISTAITDLHRVRVAIARLTLYISKRANSKTSDEFHDKKNGRLFQ